MALNVLLHIAAGCMAVKFRLRESEYLDDCEPGHSEILAHFDLILGLPDR